MADKNGGHKLLRSAGRESTLSYIRRIMSQKSDIVLVYLFLFILMAVTQVLNSKFLTFYNLRNLMASTLPYLFIALAQMTVILLGGIDLSVGAMISVTVSVCAVSMGDGPMGWVPGVLAAIALGACMGFINGVVVVKGRLQAIVATLATSSIYGGVAYLILPTPGGYINPEFAKLLTGYAKGLKVIPFVIFIVVVVLMWVFLTRTKLGRDIYATGGNAEAAYASGIKVERVKIVAFVVCGIISALCGIYVAARTQSGDPAIGNTFTNYSIASAVIGGTALAGGRGTPIGTVAGVLIIVVVNNMLNLLRVESYYQYLMLGLMMVVALTLSAIRTRGK